ncbi:MAG: hypothetical protein JXB35_08510, partial [Anaerolineae bacterium]|nr:hypothetical protein [Anaerolineae bacterium]
MAVHNGRPVILLYADAARSDPDTVAIMQPDFGAGDLYVRRTDPAAEHAIVPPYPLDEILVVNLLAKGRGVLLHSCAVDDDGHGTLFLGESGAGKSTTARLWSEAGVRVLNDDRVIVRQSGGRFWAYGTPWHGDALTVSL